MAALGLKIALPAAFSDLTLPVLHDDALLTVGSLVLLDPSHSANPLTAIPSVAGGSVPNIAWRECAAAIGSGTQTTLACALQADTSYTDGTDGKFELSVKGGIHGIISPTTQTAANKGVRLNASSLIAAYLYANQSHHFFFSQEISFTRALPSGSAYIARLDDKSALAKYLGGILDGGSNVNNSIVGHTGTEARFPLALNPTGPAFVDGGWTAWASAPSSAANTRISLASWGRSGVENSVSNTYASFIVQRAYLEDLTVSGRSYATVDALFSARNGVDMLTAGGRYYGDTYVTNPTTLA